MNLRAGYPTYTLSRGASSPLEYFSIQVWLSTCHNSISTFFSFVNRFLQKIRAFIHLIFEIILTTDRFCGILYEWNLQELQMLINNAEFIMQNS